MPPRSARSSAAACSCRDGGYANSERANHRNGLTLAGMAEWWSIEVFDSQIQAALSWKDSYRNQLVELAITSGAVEWAWTEHRHGVVLEVCFPDELRWQAFRDLPGVQAALDAVPDPTNGLIVYRGRGGGAGARTPRRPKPSAGAGALELPEPVEEQIIDLTVAELGRGAPGQLESRSAVNL
jgi:hypothetical protein